MLRNNFIGTDGYAVPGENIEFSVKCTRCGHDAFVTTSEFYDTTDKINPNAMTLNLRCDCNNSFTAIIYRRGEN